MKTLGLHLNRDMITSIPASLTINPKYATSGGHFQCRKLPQCIFGGFSILGGKSKFRDNGEIIGCYK